MPRWAIWLLNLIVVAVLAALAYFLKWAGTEFTIGCLAGFWFCYIVNGCWKRDVEKEAKEREDWSRPLSQQHLSDR